MYQQPLLRLLVWHTVLTVSFLGQFENKQTLFQEEEFAEMSHYVWLLLEISIHQILYVFGQKRYSLHLVLRHCDYFYTRRKILWVLLMFTELSNSIIMSDKGLVLFWLYDEVLFCMGSLVVCGIQREMVEKCCIGLWKSQIALSILVDTAHLFDYIHCSTLLS